MEADSFCYAEQGHHRPESWGVHIFAAMSAGATGTIVTNPLWVVKTRFMTQPRGQVRYRHTLDAILTIYRTEGVGAFYRGLVPSLMGVTHVAVQFPLYEKLKSWFAKRDGIPTSSLPYRTILICTAISKMTASLATYPHEVVRTRLQIQNHHAFSSMLEPSTRLDPSPSLSSSKPAAYHGVVRTALRVVREEGWRALYKGLSINLVRTVPNSAVTMLTYELIMRHLSTPQQQQ